MKKSNNLGKLKNALGKACRLDEPLSKHTTLKIGGPARLFINVDNEGDLIKCIENAHKFKIPLLIIGGGSNLLVSDNGFEGLVILNTIRGYQIVGEKVKVKSGTNLKDFIGFLVKKGFAGMEKMYGIPGTVGGAIYGNAGAYGQSISDNLINVRIFDGNKIKFLTKKDCKFGYRNSGFKKSKCTILKVEFEFNRVLPELLQKIALNTQEMRYKKFPPNVMSPGCFYKNIPSKDLHPKVLKKIPEEKVVYGKVPAGYLMEAVGAKGASEGNIRIMNYHGNLIVNMGGGIASDFDKLARKYAKKVENKFGIKLEPEVQRIGFKNIS